MEANDIFGIKGITNSIEHMSKSATAFLGRICNPAAEELGEMFRDEVKHWRSIRMIQLASKTEAMVQHRQDSAELKVSPRIAHKIFEEGSWTDDELIQDMWAGLLASSCTPTGQDESGLMFIRILEVLSPIQARILNFSFDSVKRKKDAQYGWELESLSIRLEELYKICNASDRTIFDRELQYLYQNDLLAREVIIVGPPHRSPVHMSGIVDITPTWLTLDLVLKSRGIVFSIEDYWKDLDKRQRQNKTSNE